MAHVIKSQFYPAIADKAGFLQPLNDPEIQAIITTSGVDDRASVYTVKRVLLLYLFAGLLNGIFHPLRGIVRMRENLLAQWFVGLSQWTLSGLSDANRRIPARVFQELYLALSKRVRSPFAAAQLQEPIGTFKMFDATYLRLCLALIPWGKPQNQRTGTGQMLLSLRLDKGGYIPDAVNLDSNPANCETHFERLIDWTQRQITYLFDRGYRGIETLVKLHRSGNFFLTRWNQSVHLTVIKNLLLGTERRGNLDILRDQIVRLGTGKKRAGELFRRVTARYSPRRGDPTILHFLTNRFDLDPFDVAAIYRYRWQIELFFKWLKSGLHIHHFITYSENGVYAQIYITLILNLLLAIYHQQHRLTCRFGINTQRAVINQLFLVAIAMGMAIARQFSQEHPWPIQAIPPPPVDLVPCLPLVTSEIIRS